MPTYNGSSWHLFNSFRKWIADGTFDLDAASAVSLYVSLHTSALVPAATLTVKADMAALPGGAGEVANGAGGIYVTGGKQLTPYTWDYLSAQVPEQVKLAGPNLAWAVSSGSLAAMYAVLRVSGTVNGRVDPLVGWAALDETTVPGVPSTVTTSSGQTLTLSNPNGIILLYGGN